jgi:hypothetical protein
MTPQLIGGEMMVWSDLDGKHGPGPVRAATLRPLLATAFGRTLVAGPHSPHLLDSLPSSQLTLLARGLPDADRLADRFAGRPDVTVLCGSLEKLAAVPAYDTVIALDGLGRLRSAEDDAAGAVWSDDLTRLVSVLRPGGRLLLGVENLFGLHRLLALPPAPTDADWGDVADEYDPTRAAAPAQLRAALAALGLEMHASYAAFPTPGDPSLLLATDLLADRSVRGWATAAIRSAFAPEAGHPLAAAQPTSAGAGQTIGRSDGGSVLPGSGQTSVRSDDGSVVSDAGQTVGWSGHGAVLADPARITAGALRAGIGAELAPAWVVVAQGGAGEPAPQLPAAIVGHGTGLAEISDMSALPNGPTLDELILAASLRRDLPGLRELLAGWQTGEHAGVPADHIVVGPDGSHTALVPAGRPETALAQLAGAMIREGHSYLWPAPADRAELTALLAAMAGRELGEIPAVAEPPAPDLRELVMERDRLARELADARAKHTWYENMLLGREAELKRVRRINTMLMATMPGKAAKASYGGLRAAKRALRKLKS